METQSQTHTDLPQAFESREDLVSFLRETFPGPAARDEAVSPTRGGRKAALERLKAVEPGRYGRTRNHLDGDVSRLSAYLRHGVLDLAEVRDAALDKAGEKAAWKFVNELAWRDYWQRLYDSIGDGVWEDREEPKTGHPAESYGADLPKMLEEGRTGLACMDGFVAELHETGYLHNHARMWMAAYVVHFLKVRWQAGARWFLTHLLDGDPASNNLSWQWVGSTFSGKPYFFNRDNIEKYTDGRYCETCAKADTCPFDASYDDLAKQLFPNAGGQR